MSVDVYRVEPGSAVRLRDLDPEDRCLHPGDKDAGKELFEELNDRLEELQELLYAEGRQRLLMVLQATDTGGKDGTIRRVFDGVNPQGVKVACFKKPTLEEFSHDFLWRIHRHTPARGEIVIFNRSHYEDVLVPQVHGGVDLAIWERRYDHINAFERMLADEGTTIVKFFLHISREEQRERLQSRLDDPRKHWKFSRDDLAKRALWDRYQDAYQAMLERTSTPHAPWFVVPANRKWYRDIVVSRVLIETLEALNMRYPDPEDDIEGLVIE